MSFQSVVNRNFTTGFPGEIVRDGPTRGKVVRFAPQATTPLQTSARNDGNIIARAFGYSGEVSQGPGSTTLAMLTPEVVLGGANYAGVLLHPKHYVLSGTALGGSLAPSLALAYGSEGEVFTMAIPVVQLINPTTGVQNIAAGWALAYVPTTMSDVNDPQLLPFGALIAYDPAGAVPTGFVAIPGSRVENPISLIASAPGALVAGLTIVSLTL